MQTDSVPADSIDSISALVEEEPMPATADELFDDFFFNYAASRKVQKKRTTFPLPVTVYGKTTPVEIGQWKTEHFFMAQGYYTLIFTSQKQLNLVKDTTVSSVVVEKIFIRKGELKRWHFARKRGEWRLDSIKVMSLRQHPDAAFLLFYDKFVSDPDFQQQSLSDPVTFSGPDPDDDFSTMTGDILPEQWPMFAPWMPSATIYNIIYGDQPFRNTNTRYFLLRGISNGMQTDIVFVRSGRNWKLKKVTT